MKLIIIPILSAIFFHSCFMNPFINEALWPKDKSSNPFLFFLFGVANYYSLSYSGSPFAFPKGGSITTQTPTHTGTLSNCTSTPTLPTGLSLNSTTCAISGTPTTVQSERFYTITADGSDGKRSGDVSITVRALNTFKFTSSSDRSGNTNINCTTQDESSGIGPYTINVPYDEDVLITLSSSLRSPTAQGGAGGDTSPVQVRFYIDGTLQKTFIGGRQWGQDTALGTAFVMPMTKGDHTLELKYCGTATYYPFIIGANFTIITATSLPSSPYYDKKASYILPTGLTNLPASGPFTNIIDGSTPMAATYASTNSVLLWQSIAFGGGVSLNAIDENFRLSPETSEDLVNNGDGYSPINKFSYSPLAANSTLTINAQYSGTNTTQLNTNSKYDNSLHLIGFKSPSAGNYGKSVLTSQVSTASVPFVPLMNINISNSYDAKYLITFTANNAHGNAAGDVGCIFGLIINGGAAVAQTVADNVGVSSRRPASIVTIETIPAGTIAVEIQYKQFNAGVACIVDNAVFTIVPLE